MRLPSQTSRPLRLQYCQTRVLDEPGKGLRELEGLQPKRLPVQNHMTGPNQFVLLAARTKAASSALKRAVSSQKGA
jgi:hypothetical protein